MSLRDQAEIEKRKQQLKKVHPDWSASTIGMIVMLEVIGHEVEVKKLEGRLAAVTELIDIFQKYLDGNDYLDRESMKKWLGRLWSAAEK